MKVKNKHDKDNTNVEPRHLLCSYYRECCYYNSRCSGQFDLTNRDKIRCVIYGPIIV